MVYLFSHSADEFKNWANKLRNAKFEKDTNDMCPEKRKAYLDIKNRVQRMREKGLEVVKKETHLIKNGMMSESERRVDPKLFDKYFHEATRNSTPKKVQESSNLPDVKDVSEATNAEISAYQKKLNDIAEDSTTSNTTKPKKPHETSKSRIIPTSEQYFEVEKIVSIDTEMKLVEVKWEGYDSSDNTFEPYDNLGEDHRLELNRLLEKAPVESEVRHD